MSDAIELSAHVKDEIEHWKARFPEDRRRSAVLSALHAVQHENAGYLTTEQMNAVAAYLDLPTIQVYEVATFYSMFQTRPVGRHNVAICTNNTSRKNSASRRARARPMAASISSAKKSVWQLAAVRR